MVNEIIFTVKKVSLLAVIAAAFLLFSCGDEPAAGGGLPDNAVHCEALPEEITEIIGVPAILTSDYVPVTEIIVIDVFGTGGWIPINTIGDTFKLPTIVLPENATYKELAFSSSNPNFVSVDENGLLTALDFGCSIVTVTAENGVSVSVHVDSGRNIVFLSESNSLILQKGDIFDLNNTFLANRESVRDTIIWDSQDLTIPPGGGFLTWGYSTRATVENGIVTCLEPGLVLIRRKLICEHMNTRSSEWFLTIEE